MESLIQQTVAELSKLEIFVDNAGIEKKIALVDLPLEEHHGECDRSFSVFEGAA